MRACVCKIGNKFFREQHICLSNDFNAFRCKGVLVHVSKFFILKQIRSENVFTRIGVVVSKRVGCAVTRNYTKRILREIFRTHMQWDCTGTDSLVIAKPAITTVTFMQIKLELLLAVRILKKKFKSN